MGKIISLSAVILGCILLARAEPAATNNNGYEYNSNLLNGAYMASKEGHRENVDYYTGGSNGQSLTTSRNQGNLEESLRSSSYNAFSPSSHNAGYSEYSSNARDSLASSPYLVSNPAQSTFETYTSSSGNGDSTFETYTQGTDQAGSDYAQFASKPKTSAYMRFGDNLSGASSTAAYSELGAEAPSFKEYSGDAFRGHTSQREYMDGDQVFSREPSNSFRGSTDYPYGKQKDSMFGIGGGSKFMNDMHPFHSETRYVRGNHGAMGSHVYLSSSPSSPFTRGSAGPYSSGKYSKYNKYMGEYTPSGSLNYLSKEPDVDYLLGNYGKGGGKLVPFKETRPSYGSQAYLPGPSYLSKIIGNYKSKPSFMSYSSGSPAGYSPMSNLHSSLGGSSYADSPLLRRYRSSNYVVPAHTSPYVGYY
ncbi:uncharacterized protein LOC105662546 isoform X2 [Megachile rotundata]|uniref:uncharacterized protein LOC105662546 isoform X2 n=1 Tax=Megachile rotundata TaxID=143995 RepID=UPI000614D01B|nr:PREDICTED: uncharacterized protein LOC105662546 isoform X2 [Megachile rotundata]